jgi:heme/copper-type cytochrome/quinol oxidase subunit 3
MPSEPEVINQVVIDTVEEYREIKEIDRKDWITKVSLTSVIFFIFLLLGMFIWYLHSTQGNNTPSNVSFFSNFFKILGTIVEAGLK